MERNLSTPLSRLVGHWQTKDGCHLYFGEVRLNKGSFIRVLPDKEKIIKNLIEVGEEITDEYRKNAEKFGGATINCQFDVLSQDFEGLKIELEIICDIPDVESEPQKITYYIDKDGKYMTSSTFFAFLGEEIHNYTPIEYIDSKTTPEDKK